MPPTTTIAIIAIGSALVAGALMALSHHKKAGCGDVKLVGEIATVETRIAPEGAVIVRGELWRARSKNTAAIPSRALVRVVGFEGHLAVVEVCD